jgi:ribonuclease J
MVTGSQGEPGSALARIALLQMKGLEPSAGDAVIFSSRAIPGNDRAIGAVINQLLRLGAEVYDTHVAEVHVSGHACRDELRAMIHMTRPELFVPLHGEYRNLVHHARLAVESGVAARNCFTLVDGEVLEVDGDGASRADTVEVGRVLVDGSGVGDVDEAVVRDRRHIAEDGVVTVIVAIKRQTGEIVEGPDFVVRGLASPEEEAEAFEEARRVVRSRILELGPAAAKDLAELQEEVRLAARRFFRRRFGRRPVVVPYVMEL